MKWLLLNWHKFIAVYKCLFHYVILHVNLIFASSLLENDCIAVIQLYSYMLPETAFPAA